MTQDEINMRRESHVGYYAKLGKKIFADENQLGSDDSEGEIDLAPFYDVYFTASIGLGTPLQVSEKYFFSTTSIETVVTGKGCPADKCAEEAYDYTVSTSAVDTGVCIFDPLTTFEFSGEQI
jgi:hypothetical protein